MARSVAVHRARTLRPKRRRSRQHLVRSTVAAVLFFAIWQALVAARALDPVFVGSPAGIVQALGDELIGGRLWPDLEASGLEYLLGFGLGIVCAIVLGVLIGWFRFLEDVAEPFIAGFYSTPYIAFLPVIVLWAGIGLWSKVIIIFWATFFPMLINTVSGVKNTPPDFLRVARSFSVGRLRLLLTVVVPAAVPYILAGLRQSIGRGLVGVIVAEFYISNRGIGFFISKTTAAFETSQAFAAILIIGAVGILLVRVVATLERRVSLWSGTIS